MRQARIVRVHAAYADVCEELDRRRRITPGLDRIRELLAALGNPERSMHVVQVVGTNGKGTTAVALAAALEELGSSAGTYLSPHVLQYTERVVIRGRQSSKEEFAAGMGRAMRVADANVIPASQFELLTAGALAMFRDDGLSWAVLEAGLGARYDATTAAEPEVVVLTNVALDHTEYLGETVEEIAREKLASLQPGTKLLLGTDDPSVAEIADDEVRRRGARLLTVGNVGEDEFSGLGFVPYAAHDVGLGFAAAEVLLERALSPQAKKRAASWVRGVLPGRFEEHELYGVPVVVDGGHNPEGMRAALDAVQSRFGERPVVAVFGALQDKDLRSMLRVLGGEVQALMLTRPAGAGERAADPEGVRRDFGPKDATGGDALVVEDAREAVRRAAREARGVSGVVLVVGSLYMGGEVLGWLRDGAPARSGDSGPLLGG